MQGISRAVRSCREILKSAILQHSRGGEVAGLEKIVSRLKWVTSPPAQEKGLENVTVADVLATKGNVETGPWLWCHTNDAVIDAVKNMAKNNIGSLLVLKPGEHQHIAGIITERDYLRKVIAQERSPIYTRVGEIMTNENQLITVTSDMNVLQAMQLMTENHIRHAPVIDGKLVGMISIKDVVRAVVEQQSGELKRLTGYIKGEYY
ncbi:CBS domain-containing protein CBSX3, mitochondrial [Malus sylvestris]|uniref:CBS domain-containing protein CBSX3, mitochondrial n=1 Tax=Malus sylvestris TaxID=3752 RepID=UPI0021ABC9DB|nr:CBS domain-containing protein CBSX3, mitochondrial [Malus sylvestris]